MMSAALLLVLQLAAASAPLRCDQAHLLVLHAAQERIARGDGLEAMQHVRAHAAPPVECPLLAVARLALIGWEQARALAAAGGAAELLGPVQHTIEQLRAYRDSEAAVEAEYGATAVRAAIAAAQDERPEMELLITHARDLAQRLQWRERRAEWPRSFNLLSGELWFEVDRYEDARLAYERAVRADASAAALIGLARAQARLGQTDAACATYMRVTDVAPALGEAAAADLAHCR